MKTILYLEVEGFPDGSFLCEFSLGSPPSIGRFGPQMKIADTCSDDFGDAIRDIAKVLETHPEIQRWAKAQTE